MDYDVILTVVQLVTLLSTTSGKRFTGAIPIGAIFDTRDVETQRAFELALARHRRKSMESEPTFYFNLTMDTIDITDNFEMARALCRQMAEGVFAFLGQKSIQTANIVHSLTSIFHMPFITPSNPVPIDSNATRNDSDFDSKPSYEIHLKPDVTAAIVDVIETLQWEHVHFMYDSEEGLKRLQHIHRNMKNKTVQWFSIIKFNDTSDVHEDLRIVEKPTEEEKEQPKKQPTNKEEDSETQEEEKEKIKAKYFVLDLSSEEAYRKVLKQIPEVGMNKFGYNYLLGTLDLKSLNLSRFRHGGANVTGFQLLREPPGDDNLFLNGRDRRGYVHHGLQVQAALTVDGLTVLEDAISAMIDADPDSFRRIFRRGVLYNNEMTKGIPCTTRPPDPWMFGEQLLDFMKEPNTTVDGLSGRLSFDSDGYRQDYSLDVYSMVLDEGLENIGTWTPKKGFTSIHDRGIDRSRKFPRRDKNASLVITSILTKPFLMLEEEKEGEPPLVGNARFKGYCMDLADALAKEVGFDFKMKVVADGNYGKRLGNNTWNGMIGEILDGDADMALAPLTITSERERYVDFSKPFMEIGAIIMIKKPQNQRPGDFSFMEPLSVEVWVCIIMAYITVSVGLFLVSRFSPIEWKKVKDEVDTSYHNDFSLYNSFWFSMGALMFQGSDTCPRSVSGRIIGGAWWFFVLIIISSYTANLAAFLTIERMIKPIESADDLLNHPTIKYGAVSSGSTLQFFVESDVPVFRQMGAYMTSNPDVLVQSNDEGVERVLNSKGKYAFIAENPVVDYFNNQDPCETTDVGPHLNTKGYGVATPRNSEFRDRINVAVLTLKEEGKLHIFYQKWWVEKGQCGGGVRESQKGKLSLTLSNVAGIFYILVVGLVVAIILGVFEFLCFRAKHKSEDVVTGEGYLKGTSTHSTLCNTPNDREDGMLPSGEFRGYQQQPSPAENMGYIGFEKFSANRENAGV